MKDEYFQRFKLQPGTYIFSTAVKSFIEDVCVRNVNFQVKTGSISECKFDELNCKKFNRFSV